MKIETDNRRPLKVLVGCEESQRVCSAFRKLGHEAYSCDLVACSGGHPEWHIQGDVLPLLENTQNMTFTTQDGQSHTLDGRFDLMILHPECRYLSVAGSCRLFHHGVRDEARYQKGLKAQRFFRRCLKANCDHIAVENPIQMTSVFDRIPKWTQTIQPWFWKDRFNENYQKTTRLWLKGLPNLKADITEKPKDVQRWVNAGQRKDGVRVHDSAPASTSKMRAQTFKGVAWAMATQWSEYVSDCINSGLDDAMDAISTEDKQHVGGK